jgi:ABC-2 type transport system ATP-binding protein
MTTAVSIQGVHKRYGALHALNDVSFTVERGSFFGLLGPNGAGKSTLIGVMAGLVRASAGQVSIMGHDVVRAYRYSRQALGVVPQELVYDPFFTVREMLRLQSGYFGLGRENRPWIDELLETLSLTDKADTNLHNLSGGMKRRVLIAQALVHKPEVVVLDEPTAGVDVELRQALWHFTQRLHRDGRTILLTTHYLEEAEALCDNIAILNRGELVALDSKRALLERAQFRILNVCVDRSAAVPEALRPLLVETVENRFTFRLRRDVDNMGEVLGALQSAGLKIIDLNTEEAGLEEVFLSITGGTPQ